MNMPSSTLKDWLEKGPFTLALSSSFFGFFAHCGVVSAIWNRQLAPRKITGASAGALVGGALASGLAPEAVQEILFGVKKEDFWDPSWGPGLLRGQKFLELLEKHFVSNFEQALIPFEAAVFDLFACKTQFLHQGSLPKAIAASCAVPLMFRPVRIGTRFYFDGGVFHKSGINVTHSNERILCVFLQNDGLADGYEWGGRDPRGKTFKEMRPNWELPIHQLFVKTGVTIFFQGHDHLFARQEKDGVIYQEVPNPADPTYTAFNVDAYVPDRISLPGGRYDPAYGVTLPNAGHLVVTVSPSQVTVAYIRAVLTGDEAKAGAINNAVAFSYTVPAPGASSTSGRRP